MAWDHSDKKKRISKKNRKTKQLLMFDENARRDYLTGFRKRKDERRRVAAEKLLQEMKDEKKRLKEQVREMMKSRVDNQPAVPEVQHLLDPTIYDLPSHTVTVTDISEVDLTGKDGLWLGQNTFKETVDKEKLKEEPDKSQSADKPAQNKSDPKEVKRLKRKMAKLTQNNMKKLKQTQKKKSGRRQKHSSKSSKGKKRR